MVGVGGRLFWFDVVEEDDDGVGAGVSVGETRMDLSAEPMTI